MMDKTKLKMLADLTGSEVGLADVLGYFECFDEKGSTPLLCAIAFCFDGLRLYIVAQEDDSLELYSGDWCPDSKWAVVSLIERQPWSSAKGKPLLWSWILFNQQEYFDGLQLEFATNSGDQSVVVQLVIMGCEVKQRLVEYQCRTVAL